MKPRARGYALLLMLALLGLGSMAYLAVALRGQNPRTDVRAQRDTLRALHDARLALIAHSLIEDNTPGALLNPASGVNGDSDSSGTGSPGNAPRRLPWRTLALQKPRDGDGECLWYVVNTPWRNVLSTGSRSTADGTALNPATPGTLTVTLPGSASAQRAIAVLFAPGAILPGQTRGAASAASCSAGDAAQFLDAFSGYDNAGTTGSFLAASSNSSFNDNVLGITHSQMFRPALRRVLNAFNNTGMRTELIARGGASNATLTQLRGSAAAEYQTFDQLLAGSSATLDYGSASCPAVQLSTQKTYKFPVSWLCFNDWYAHISYQGLAQRLVISLAPHDARSCTLNLLSGSISCTG